VIHSGHRATVGNGESRCGTTTRTLTRLWRFLLLREHGLTPATLVAKLVVTRQTVITIESGKCDLSFPLAFTIARTFEQTPEQIFTPESRESRPKICGEGAHLIVKR
jgi:putative transcriptional regulator